MKPYYEDGTVTIYHGDARELVSTLAPVVIVTDPPYGIAWSTGENRSPGHTRRAHSGILNDEDTSMRDGVLAEFQHTPALVFGSFYAPFPSRLRQVLVWPKPPDAGLFGSVTGFRRDAEPVFVLDPWPQRLAEWSCVLPSGGSCIGSYAKAAGHPHAKPVGLMRYLVARCPAGTVLDPFCGSGSTLRAAKDFGRKAIGIETEERYCEIAAKRCAQDVLDFGEAA